MGRKELLLALALLFLLGVGATAARLLEARRTGLSLRLQVFIPLAATTLLLSAMFAGIVIDRFTARASLFATRAAEDEARAIAELAARTPRDSLGPILQAFTRSAIDTDVALLDSEGREVRALTHALESRRRELEERHALENFVADVSHELKNPVAAIRASAEVLTEGAADEPETARRFALRIREGADKLQQLTQDLLSLARLEARGIEPKDEPVDLCEIAREVVDAQSPTAAARHVRVELKASGSSRVRGDPVWLRRALENRVGNAVQHSPEGAHA